LTSSSDFSAETSRLSIGEVFGVIGLIAAQLVIATGMYVVVILLSFNADSCAGSGTCDYGMAGVSLYLIPIATGITVLLSVIFTIVLTRQGRSALLIPTVGIFVVIITGIIAIILNLKAFT
jgi:hypothetical protein